jgi:hypothetical protein
MFDEVESEGMEQLLWTDGRIYEGEFSEDKANGKGEMIWPDDRKYIG